MSPCAHMWSILKKMLQLAANQATRQLKHEAEVTVNMLEFKVLETQQKVFSCS